VFKRDPNARLVVNAGFAHIQKSGKYLGGSSMAEFFQKISGIEPVCIEQTMMMQHARPDQDHPHFAAIVAGAHLPGPTVYVGADGKDWTLKPGQYDASVVFPPQNSDTGKPAWAALGGQRVPYPVNGEVCRGVLPCLIEARYANEGDDAIPADRVRLAPSDSLGLSDSLTVVTNHDAKGELFLRPGSYRVSSSDAHGHVLFTRDITVGTAEAAK
jgi:hypothetical protein